MKENDLYSVWQHIVSVYYSSSCSDQVAIVFFFFFYIIVFKSGLRNYRKYKRWDKMRKEYWRKKLRK